MDDGDRASTTGEDRDGAHEGADPRESTDPRTEGDLPESRPPRSPRRRRWLWWATAAGMVVVLVIAFAWWRSAQGDDDPLSDDALPDGVRFGEGSWPTRGSLAEDIDSLREAAELLDPDREHRVLWAGRAGLGPEETDVVVFGPRGVGFSDRENLHVAQRGGEGEWELRGMRSGYEVDSWGRLLLELPFEVAEGIDDGADRFFLAHDDVEEEAVRALDGREFSANDGVLGVAEEDDDIRGVASTAYEVPTTRGRYYVSGQLAEPLPEDTWPEEQAQEVLDFFAHGVERRGGELQVTLGEPREVRFAEGLGAVVPVRQEGAADAVLQETDNPEGQRWSAVVLHPDAEAPMQTGHAVDGAGDEDVPGDGKPSAMALPEGLRDGSWVVVTEPFAPEGEEAGADRVETVPDLPVVGEPVEDSGAVVYGEAPARTAVIWNDEEGEPERTALVDQYPDH